ncbi:MAG: nucleotide-binding protein [Chloroflexota bacterium]
MNESDLFEELVSRVGLLQFGDNAELDMVKRMAEMRIRHIFGEESNYLGDLSKIRFFSGVWYDGMPAKFDRDAFASGKQQLINLLNVMIEDIQLSNSASTKQVKVEGKSVSGNKIFVVHGHDNEMKQSTARTLEKLGLEPIILHEQANEGKTIIEKFLNNAEQVSFAVVLLSPDDVGRSIKLNIEKTRARQNVILELGFFIGWLGRERVFVLHKRDDNFELPSDIFGVLYESYDGDAGGWRFNLARELKNVGYDIDMNDLA